MSALYYYDDPANAVPDVWKCGLHECVAFSVCAIPSTGSDLPFDSRKRCQSHVVTPANALGVNPSGGPVELEYGYTPYATPYFINLHTSVRNLIHVHSQLNDANGRATQSARALSAFKEQVVETTVEWDGGCRSGKEEFLDSLGLEWPSVTVTVTATFEYSGDPDDISTYSLESGIEGSLDASASNINVEVEW
jgi:hypothetical protein